MKLTQIIIILIIISFSPPCLSQTIFNKDSLTILADSLQVEGFYDESLALRKEALKTY